MQLSRLRYQRALAALFWTALLVRLGFVLLVHPPGAYVYSDMESYDSVARQLLSGQPNVWHSFRPVAYSMWLALLYALSDGSRTLVGVVQAAMGAHLVRLGAELARCCGVSRGWALAVALVVAGSVPLLLYTGLILTEVPSAFFLLWGTVRLFQRLPEAGRHGFWAVVRRLAAPGLALGSAAAMRPNLLLLLPLLVCYALRSCASRGRACALVLAASAALALAPPVLYNSQLLGQLSGPARNGGLNFYLNFADVRSVRYQGAYGGYWIAPVPNGFDHLRDERSQVPFFDEPHYYRAGVQHIVSRPYSLVEALRNFPEAAGIGRQLFWPGWPGHAGLLRGYGYAFFAAVLLPAAGLLLALAWTKVRRQLSRNALWLALLCLAGTLPMYFFLGDPRVRVPFDPFWAVLAALALQASARVLRRDTHPSAPSIGPGAIQIGTKRNNDA